MRSDQRLTYKTGIRGYLATRSRPRDSVKEKGGADPITLISLPISFIHAPKWCIRKYKRPSYHNSAVAQHNLPAIERQVQYEVVQILPTIFFPGYTVVLGRQSNVENSQCDQLGRGHKT